MEMMTTFGVIVGDRGFFPEYLVRTGHEEIKRVLAEAGYGCVILEPGETKMGSVENHEDARKCAELFAKHADEIDGIIITLPNFGDERSIVNSISWSGLEVPVLVQAEPDDAGKMTIKDRRDSFCGKISVCNNLRQRGIPYTLTQLHCEGLGSEEFAEDLESFAATCRVTSAVPGSRFGAIGARTSAFTTVRYSEKILESAGISVETLDLSEILAAADKVRKNSKEFQEKVKTLKGYVKCMGVTDEAFARMARLGVAIDRWVAENDLDAIALQCWTAIEELYGVVPCAVMSVMSNSGVPAACEVDITGALSMYALQAASRRPSAVVDWNNNYGDDPDKCVAFHCSNLPKDIFAECRMGYQAIIADSVGKENAYGTIDGRIKASAATFARVTTDDTEGIIRAYVGEGAFTDDPLETFGGYGVLEVPDLQGLMEYVCRMGFEHHVAVNLSSTSEAMCEAFENYLGWDVYCHI